MKGEGLIHADHLSAVGSSHRWSAALVDKHAASFPDVDHCCPLLLDESREKHAGSQGVSQSTASTASTVSPLLWTM